MVLGVTTVVFLDGVLATHGDLTWRLLSVVGLAWSLWGLRLLHGAAVVVRRSGLRVQQRWPLRRDIAWYRIFEVEVVPVTWNLELELNSGERLALPCVEHVEELYAAVEESRTAIGT